MDSERVITVDHKNAKLSVEDFEFFRALILKWAGIRLSEKKRELLVSRLNTYIQKNNFISFSHYRSVLEKEEGERQSFINLLTTNKTSFFREPKHGEYLVDTVIPGWVKAKKQEVLGWSCASSSGEEAYTLAMLLEKNASPDIGFKILATDIDTRVLEKARNGVYSMAQSTEIPDPYFAEYAKIGHKQAAGWFRIADHIHKRISFKQHNLIEDTYPGEAMFDFIFCRNVLIYFSPETIRKLMQKLHRSLKSDGLLFIGHTESLKDCGDLFLPIKPSIYKKV